MIGKSQASFILLLTILASISSFDLTSKSRKCAEQSIIIAKTGISFPEVWVDEDDSRVVPTLQLILDKIPEYEMICNQPFPKLESEIRKLLPRNKPYCHKVIAESVDGIVRFTKEQEHANPRRQLQVRYYVYQYYLGTNLFCGWNK